ncbi:MAG: nucleotide exchange factor GrpE [Leptospirillum sp.]
MTRDPLERERLIEQFREYMESLDAEPPPSGTEDRESVDLVSLLTEMAVLKNEVRQAARWHREALDELRRFGEGVREENGQLSRELEKSREQTAKKQRQSERSLLLDILDLRDRMTAGLLASRSFNPSFLGTLLAREGRFVRSLSEGMELTLGRLDDLLSKYRVREIKAEGLPLDPYRMCVVGVEENSLKARGTVVREVRKGYLHGDDVLRLAEVVVTTDKQGEPGSSPPEPAL